MRIGKKTVVIEAKGFLYHIRFKEGGVIPNELSGSYTNKTNAELAVLKYNSEESTQED